jgi:hypothetical protein
MANLILIVQGEIEEFFSHIHQVVVNSRLARGKLQSRLWHNAMTLEAEEGHALLGTCRTCRG